MNKLKQVQLININTGKTFKAKSIVAFTKKCGYKDNERYHITPVIYGNRIQYDGWVLPETYKLINKKFKVKDIFENKYNISIKELYFKFNIKSCLPKLIRFKQGKEKCLKGLYLDNKEINNFIPKNYIVDKYIFKKGNKRYEGKTIREVEEKANISDNSLYDVMYGKRTNCKGVTFENIKVSPRKILIPAVSP